VLLGHGGQLAQVIAGRGEMVTVGVEPVGGSGGQRGGTRHRVQVRGGLEIGGDAAGRQHVQQMLADPWVDVPDHRVLLRYQAVVAPAAPRPAPWHSLPLPAADTATTGSAAKKPLTEILTRALVVPGVRCGVPNWFVGSLRRSSPIVWQIVEG
jgi:hypothetical protein